MKAIRLPLVALVVMALCIVMSPVLAAAEMRGPSVDGMPYIVSESNELKEAYWDHSECLYRLAAASGEKSSLEAEYSVSAGRLSAVAERISARVIAGLEKGDDSGVMILSSVYRVLDASEKPAFAGVIAAVAERVRSLEAEAGKRLDARAVIDDNFPGYEQSESGYIYRRGKELSSEVLETYWREEIKTFDTSETYLSEVTLDYFKTVMSNNSSIQILSWSEPYEKVIDGLPVTCIKVKLRVWIKVTLKSTRKYSKTKVWFELWRNGSYPFPGPWKLCGRTYRILEVYAGSEIVGGQAPPASGSVKKDM